MSSVVIFQFCVWTSVCSCRNHEWWTGVPCIPGKHSCWRPIRGSLDQREAADVRECWMGLERQSCCSHQWQPRLWAPAAFWGHYCPLDGKGSTQDVYHLPDLLGGGDCLWYSSVRSHTEMHLCKHVVPLFFHHVFLPVFRCTWKLEYSLFRTRCIIAQFNITVGLGSYFTTSFLFLMAVWSERWDNADRRLEALSDTTH